MFSENSKFIRKSCEKSIYVTYSLQLVKIHKGKIFYHIRRMVRYRRGGLKWSCFVSFYTFERTGARIPVFTTDWAFGILWEGSFSIQWGSWQWVHGSSGPQGHLDIKVVRQPESVEVRLWWDLKEIVLNWIIKLTVLQPSVRQRQLMLCQLGLTSVTTSWASAATLWYRHVQCPATTPALPSWLD